MTQLAMLLCTLLATMAFAMGVAATEEPARHAFSGTLEIPEFVMQSQPAAIHDGLLLGEDPQRFPAVRLDFITDSGELLPARRDIVLTQGGSSYWDLIVDPGRVWSLSTDSGMSRASFPFVLMNHIEGESHNGVASFLYDDKHITQLSVRIVQQTAPFYLARPFVAHGEVEARYTPRALPQRDAILAARVTERSHRLETRDWAAFAAQFPGVATDALAARTDGPATVTRALATGDTIYTSGCRSADGDFPYCEAMRHGVWSVTKTMVPALALMRLAQKYGPQVYEQRIADYLPGARANPAWARVRFIDAANMATGIGIGTTTITPNRTEDGYLDDSEAYDRWYRAPTLQKKLEITFAQPAYPWGPGKVTRYRDEDPLVLVAAMDALLKQREGPRAGLWTMLETEVFRPLGILHLPQAHTEADTAGLTMPIGAYGLYPTLADMVRVARLLQASGQWQGEALLSQESVERYVDHAQTRGLPTGGTSTAGEVLYEHYIWNVPFQDGECRVNIPQMQGWGGNTVALLPNGMIALRIARDGQDAGPDRELDALIRVAHAARGFCGGSD